MNYDHNYTDYQINRSRLRRLIRSFYLRKAAKHLTGRTLDFGCGIGHLLRNLPEGSRGLEYNRYTVEHCQSIGLPVDWYDGYDDDWQLGILKGDFRFDSMIISHVLEHLEKPETVLAKLLKAAEDLGVVRVLVIVPGWAGFCSDPSHVTFVDMHLLSKPTLAIETGFKLRKHIFFPINCRSIGKWFIHHELHAIYERPPLPR